MDNCHAVGGSKVSTYSDVNESSALEPIAANRTLVPEDVPILQRRGLAEDDRINVQELNDYVSTTELLYGDRFMLVDSSWGNATSALIRFKLSEDLIAESANYIIHPCIIDACIQSKFCLDFKIEGSNSSIPPSLPVGKLFVIARKSFVVVFHHQSDIAPGVR